MKSMIATSKQVKRAEVIVRIGQLSIVASVIIVLLTLTVTVALASRSRSEFLGQIQPTSTVVPTPSPDPTVTYLQKQKLALEVEQLDIQNKKNTPNFINSIVSVAPAMTTILAILAGIAGVWKYFVERARERDKRAEERFEKIAQSLGSDSPTARSNAAVLLRTFLNQEYQHFHLQVFSLAASNLRPDASSGTNSTSENKDEKSHTNSLSSILIPIFRESYTEAREWVFQSERSLKKLKDEPDILDQKNESNEKAKEVAVGQHLDATGVDLDGAFLPQADFNYAWLRQASFRGAILDGALFNRANLEQCKMNDATLEGAELNKAYIMSGDFTKAILKGAYIIGTNVNAAKFTEAKMQNIRMRSTDAHGADFRNADLTDAKIIDVDFSPHQTDGKMKSTTIDLADTLKNAEFVRVKGLNQKQIDNCKKLGATFEGEEVHKG